MFIWTFSRGILALAATLGLSGCANGPDVSAAGFGFARSAPQKIAVADRSIVIAGPQGYCIDRSGSTLTGNSAFVVLGSCASISRDASAERPDLLGLLTASVATEQVADDLPEPDQLTAFVSSAGGRAALARDGQAGSVEILDTRNVDDAFLIRLRDTSQGIIEAVDDIYWRGVTDLNGRLLTISVVSFSAKPLTSDQGLTTLRAFLARIRAETLAQVAVN